jgi:hypothetical protein
MAVAVLALPAPATAALPGAIMAAAAVVVREGPLVLRRLVVPARPAL